MKNKYLLNAATPSGIKVILDRTLSSPEETAFGVRFFNGRQTYILTNDEPNYQSKVYYIPYVQSHIEIVPVSPNSVSAFEIDPQMDIIADGGGEWWYENAYSGMTITITYIG